MQQMRRSSDCLTPPTTTSNVTENPKNQTKIKNTKNREEYVTQ